MQAQRIPLPDEIAAGCVEIQSQPGWQRQHGGPRLLLAALIGHSAASIEEWSTVRSRPDEFTGVKFLECYAEARRAVAWVWSEEPLPAKAMQLSFLQVCDFLDLNPVATREQLVRRFSFECLDALGVDEFEKNATRLSGRSRSAIPPHTFDRSSSIGDVRHSGGVGSSRESPVESPDTLRDDTSRDGSNGNASRALQNGALHTMEIPGSHFDTPVGIHSMTQVVA